MFGCSPESPAVQRFAGLIHASAATAARTASFARSLFFFLARPGGTGAPLKSPPGCRRFFAQSRSEVRAAISPSMPALRERTAVKVDVCADRSTVFPAALASAVVAHFSSRRRRAPMRLDSGPRSLCARGVSNVCAAWRCRLSRFTCATAFGPRPSWRAFDLTDSSFSSLRTR